MRRILVRKPGGYGALELIEESPPPVPPGELRVAVRAAGVNYADCLVRMGYYPAARRLYPITPGFEFSGTVEALGTGAEGFAPGSRVFGIKRFGAYASHVAAEPRMLWPCPEGWDFPDCAAFPTVFLTAAYGLFRAAKVEAGETILVHSAAGGVGTALLQLAKIAGCRSVAVVGAAHKAELCRELGAFSVIDRSAQDLWREARRLAPAGYDAIFDANGLTLRKGFEHLASGGRLVSYGFAELFPKGGLAGRLSVAWKALRVPKFSPLELTGSNRGVIGFNLVHLTHKTELLREAMGKLLGWIAEGKIRKPPVTSYPLERAGEAHRDLESGKTVGKLVLTA